VLDFAFTPEQEAFRATLRRFALRELLPRYRDGDRTGEYPRAQIKQVVAMIGDVECGDDRLILAGIVAEEVARGDFNCVLPSLGPLVFEDFIAEASPEQKARWLPGLRSGDQMIGLCLTEPGAGSDMGAMRTRAERRGDAYVLTGEKNSVSYLNADVFYVFARTDAASSDWRGLSAFLVPRDAPGLTLRPYDDMGCRAIPRGQAFFDDVVVPATCLVGGEGKAFPMIRRYLDVNRAFIALKCLGAAQQTLDETIVHVRSRTQFGVPLATFQGVAFPIVEAATLLEAARWLAYRVLWLRQRGEPCDVEGAMAKWWVPEIAVETIRQCLILHGHYGYTRELPIEQRLRDVIGWQIGDGTPQIQKLILARRLLGKEHGSQ
jgi:cyclohexanecarboxyl-CoA dehydrogenase